MSIEFTWKTEDFDDLVQSCDRDTAAPYILKYMPPNGKVLDAGCGLARYVKFLSDKGFDMIGVELSQDTVNTVRRFAPELDVRQGDVLALAFEDNSISGIISLGVVEHFIEGPQRPLAEMFRVLKPGHYAVITVPSFNYVRRIKYALGTYHINPVKLLKGSNTVRRLFAKKPIIPINVRDVPYKCRQQSVSGKFFEYLFTKQEFEEELRQVGFTIVESVPIAFMDGIYHEFNMGLVSFRNWTFYPTEFGKLLNSILKKIPFCHNHMHLCVVRK